VLFVPELLVNLFSVTSLEGEGRRVVLFFGQVFLYTEGATLETTVVFGVKYERLYRLLGQFVVGSSGFLDSKLVSVSEIGSCEASSSTLKRLS